jgi:SAM-dependent methyltransferase
VSFDRDRLFKDAYLATVYDAWYPSSERTDYRFYKPYLMTAQKVLDVGCGTGTYLQMVRAAGHGGELTGLDPSAGMIQLARSYAGIRWVEGHLEDQEWENAFDLAVMTGHAFQTILGQEKMQRFLASVAKALSVGGRFIFESRNPAVRAWKSWDSRPAAAINMPDGRRVTVKTRLSSPFDGETVSFVHRFEGEHPALPLESESTLQFWDEPTLRAMLDDAGFALESEFGDFDGSSFEIVSPEIIIIARRIS